MLTEEWKPIKDYEGIYEISNRGRIRSKRVEELFTYDNGMGWLMVELYKNSGDCQKKGFSKRGSKRFKLHRLVAEHFIPNADNLRFVIHLDGDKKNCKASNLRWSRTNRRF